MCKRKKRKRRISWEDTVHVCAWCGKHIPEDTEIFSVNAKARPGADLEREGNVLELALDATRKALAIIPTEESQAKKSGWDLLFAVCSEECAKSLTETVQGQIDFIDSIAAVD
jgi:hypothetical protein